MSILKILTIPDPFLKKPALPVKELSRELASAVSDIVETMYHHRNCVGLAAPQAGIGIRLIAVDVSAYSKPHPNRGLIVLVNPVITVSQGLKTAREGCLSVPDLTGNVSRAERIAVSGMTPEGKNVSFETSGFEAVVLQHEIDHLDGLLFLDRVTSLKTDVFRRKKA